MTKDGTNKLWRVVFTVDGEPIAQPRYRTGKVRLKSGKMKRTFFLKDTHPVIGWRVAVRVAGLQARPRGWPLDAAIETDLFLVLPRLASHPKVGPRIWHTGRPDADNLEKAIFDALKGVFFTDDAQICDSRTVKAYAAHDEMPRAIVRLAVKTESGPGLEFQL